jgi:uncharacterized protein (TIGR02117 family)
MMVLSIAGCLGPIADLYPPRPQSPERLVWVVDHGWHTSLVVRTADVAGDRWPERSDFASAQFLEVAWGDRDFYTAPRGTLALALRAAVASRGSVLHVVGFDEAVPRYFPASEIVEVALSMRGFDALVQFIDDAHARGDAPRARRLEPGLYGDSGFYPARARYSLLNTCNTWIASALRAAGCPITPLWAATTSGVLVQVRPLGRVLPPGAGRSRPARRRRCDSLGGRWSGRYGSATAPTPTTRSCSTR